ncbi:acyltransferase [Novosphingobium sp. MMS21-SN21R]|uniref:acyltransferase family protein n=1 Tax=Novosphingobium sp. MMS21-SN21R TaxID=2969298 RepID=UPI002885AF5A|nr:acyltransferase [Novosphingobium sp. MMS21-SN21R]MDT0509454.1 acyltransferase [Novosphingobium sp. MMS21-SN21R]
MGQPGRTAETNALIGKPIGQYLGGRDNNLNLIRIVAASAVLVSHAYALTSGQEMSEPFRAATGLSLGQFAVAIFFGMSGLLIARSFDRRQSLAHFVSARFLRLWPALAVVLTLTAFALGPVMTSQGASEYLRSTQTLAYVPRNLSLYFRDDALPGVFAANPYGAATNGSLWSLFYEVACYGGVVALGYLGGLRKTWMFGLFLAFVVAGHVWSVIASPASGVAYRLDVMGFVGFPFALGMAAYVWRDRLSLGLAGIALVWVLVALLLDTVWLGSAIMLALVYTCLWLAFVPKGAVLAYNRLGDFSYGVYIFAYPAQQTLVALWPGHGPAVNMAASGAITLILAIASWHLVEKRALALARPAGDRLAGMFKGKDESATPLAG